MRLAGKVALVTGAAGGIGREIAERLATAGADVAVADMDFSRLDGAAAAVRSHGRESLALKVDVTLGADVAAMVQGVVDRFGRIDAFFNNAGVADVEDFLDVSEATFDRIMAVNSKGVFLCGQAVARQMVAQGGGRIVNTASIAARVGIADMAPYCASKAAVMSLTRSMALALAPHNINVNALAPGIVDTEMWDYIDARRSTLRGQSSGQPTRERVATIPLKRAAVPADIAAVAEFLVSEGASYITGQTFNIDGGVLPS